MALAERKPLAERMAQAAARTAAAREARGGVPPTPVAAGLDFRSLPPTTPRIGPTPPGGGAAAPAVAPKPAPSASTTQRVAHSAHWQPAAQPGEQLMLMPGQMHFGDKAASLRTLLGSCVAVTLWHPLRRIGGMCHFLLPSRTRRAAEALDGRYGDEALEAMVAAIQRSGTRPDEYHAHLYGGADTMPEGSGLKFNVGERNIEQGWSLIDRHGFQLQGVDVGEDVPRTVTLVLASGEVDMKRGAGRAAVPLPETAPAPLDEIPTATPRRVRRLF